MHVLELKPENDWRQALGGLAQEMRMAVSLVDSDGKPLFTVGQLNPLCSRIRQTDADRDAICGETSRDMTQILLKTNAATTSTCRGGLLRVSVPILVDGRLVGQVAACGVAVEGNAFDSSNLSRQLGLSDREIDALMEDVETRSETTGAVLAERISEAMQFLH